jgi:hypothetical protein
VTASFALSQLTVRVSGFLDVTVSAGSRSSTCSGPVRTCKVPTPVGAPIDVRATAWPGGSPTDSIAFSGPGCQAGSCLLTKAPDPTLVNVEMRIPSGRRILYFGAYPRSIRRGNSSVLLVRTKDCNLIEELRNSGDVTEEQPGVYRATPTKTTQYDYDCYYSLSGSTIRELERASTTVEVTEP